GRGRPRAGPAVGTFGRGRMELGWRDAEPIRRTAHLLQADQSSEPVEQAVFDALGRGRTGELMETCRGLRVSRHTRADGVQGDTQVRTTCGSGRQSRA